MFAKMCALVKSVLVVRARASRVLHSVCVCVCVCARARACVSACAFARVGAESRVCVCARACTRVCVRGLEGAYFLRREEGGDEGGSFGRGANARSYLW